MERPDIRRTRRTKSKIDEVLAEAIVEAAPKVDVLRPPIRDEDPRERANRRAAELMKHLGEEGLDLLSDEFYIPPAIIPQGWDYEWKRKFVVGWEDTSHQMQVLHTGWEPVPTDRHPEMMPKGTKLTSIERKGMVLMERPLEITQRIKAAEQKAARNAILSKEIQLNETPNGHMDRGADNRTRLQVKRSFDIPVPER
jgi:hypothetical protein